MKPSSLRYTLLSFFTLAFVCSAQSPDYTGPGPHKWSRTTNIKFNMDPKETDCNNGGNYCAVTIKLYYPTSSGQFAGAIFSNGFSIDSRSYESYAERLASWGYITILWDLKEGAISSPTQNARGLMASKLSEWLFNESQTNNRSPIYGKVDVKLGVVHIGHSLGGKSAVHAAIEDKNVRGYILLDPVDCPPPMPPGIPYSEDNPSLVVRMNETSAIGAIVGAELGDIGELIPCAPKECNYDKYYTNSKTTTWEVVVIGAGHAQFIEGTRSGGNGGCTSGPQKTDVVVSISTTIVIAWAEFTLYGKDISYWTSTWINSVVQDGDATTRYK